MEEQEKEELQDVLQVSKGVKDWLLTGLIHQKKILKARGLSEPWDFSDLLNLSDESAIIILQTLKIHTEKLVIFAFDVS